MAIVQLIGFLLEDLMLKQKLFVEKHKFWWKKRGYAGCQKAEVRTEGGGGQRSIPRVRSHPGAGDSHLRHDHEVQPLELSDSGQAALRSVSEIINDHCGLFGHCQPKSGAAYHYYSSGTYIYFVRWLKLFFGPDYGLLSPLRECDGHLVFLIRGCFGLNCPREQQKHSLLVITLMILGE